MALDVEALESKMCGKTKSEIAKALKMSLSRFSQKTTGLRRFTVEESLELANVLDLTIEDMREVWKGEQ